MVAVAAEPRSAAAAPRARGRSGFTLMELMVSISIIAILIGIVAGAAAAARAGQKRFKAAADIAKLDAVIQQHFTWCQSLRLPGGGSRAVLVARRISGDMPDTWADVEFMAQPANEANFQSGPQRTYVGIWRSLRAANASSPSATVADAECLYMMVRFGGLADCLACSDVDGIGIGDTDGDGAMEFLDPWGNPIRFVLWPQQFQVPPGGAFFPDVSRTRPLIFSVGPDGLGTTSVNSGGNLVLTGGKRSGLGGHDGSDSDRRADNVTNFDAEAKR
ncbi:MAG: prepilin-type N-terminal cleavage/methylation domain-containing protein [Planctomycetia bacterium]|jgi:prepilin-type N-terminal cleavage/methylation domain-containing protein